MQCSQMCEEDSLWDEAVVAMIPQSDAVVAMIPESDGSGVVIIPHL